MCSHYQGIKNRDQFERHFGITPAVGDYPVDVWPSYLAPFVRPHPHADAGDEAVPPLDAPLGAFGLLPHWAKDRSASRHTYNARTETVAQKPSFRDAWARAQHCIIPAEAIFEPDWRSGRAVSTRIALANGEPMGLAGLWSEWRGPDGLVPSFTMLTVNADAHPLMREFHKPADEKRMVVVLPRTYFSEWLNTPTSRSMDLIRACPLPELVVTGYASTGPSSAPRIADTGQSSLF